MTPPNHDASYYLQTLTFIPGFKQWTQRSQQLQRCPVNVFNDHPAAVTNGLGEGASLPRELSGDLRVRARVKVKCRIKFWV
jgi:hypothetical protein